MAYAADDDILLVDALGEIGFRAGYFDGPLAALGGRFGARLAAKLLPTHRYSEAKRLTLDVHEGFRRVRALVTPLGEWHPIPKGSIYPALRHVTSRGVFSVSNPAVVYIEVLETGIHEATVVITAFAKEGLIKQNTACKHVQKIVALLNEGLEVAA